MQNAVATQTQAQPQLLVYSTGNAAFNTNMLSQYGAFTFDHDLFKQFENETRNETTRAGYTTCLKQFAKWLDANDITKPQRDDVRAYEKYLEKSGLAVGTQAQYLRAVRQFFSWTAAAGVYPDMGYKVKGARVRHDNHKKDALEKDAVPIIADKIDRTTEQGKRLYAMYLLCITCGLRCIEVHRADIGDIKTIGEKTYLYIQGKGHDEKDAPVLLIAEVKEAIADYLQSRTDKLTAKSPLFVSTSNRSKAGRLAATTISTMLKGALVNAGYNSSRLTAHSLRHTSGTGAYKATGNIYLAQKHQRHADPATTEIYIHAEERETRETERQVYNYYFNDADTETDRREIIERINELDATQLAQLKEYIKAL